MSVLSQSGHSTDTPTADPLAWNSSDSDCDRPTTACLVATYGAAKGTADSPASDAVFPTWPSPCSMSNDANERTPCTTPMRFTPTTQSQSASVVSAIAWRRPLTPALL